MLSALYVVVCVYVCLSVCLFIYLFYIHCFPTSFMGHMLPDLIQPTCFLCAS